MFDLRYYQNELIEGAHAAWEKHQSTAIISATGTGKTEMYLSLAVSDPGRVLVLVHRDYLITQPVERLAKVGFENVAIEKAELQAEVGHRPAKVVFASVQTIGPEKQSHRLKKFDPFAFSLVIVDEGHRATSRTYRRVLDHFKLNPKVKILIMTATPNRKDGVALRTICDSVAGVYGPSQAMHDGWIVPVKFYRRDVESLDFSSVRLKDSDLDPKQVQALLIQEKPLHEVCASLAEDRGPTIVFCPEIAIADAYTKLMNTRYRPGRAVMLCQHSTEEDRQTAAKKLEQGELDYILNVNLYTEGYDLPYLVRAVWAAPTTSLVRYTQGVGRVFRTHPSLRGHLTGGRDEAARRRLLIEQSPKPFGIVVTFYPQNCAHELCDPVDILGGDDLPPDVKRFAKQVQEETSQQQRGSNTEEDIETARVFCDLRGILDARRRELKAKAEFTDHQFDPMSSRAGTGGIKETRDLREAARTAVSTWGRGEPATEKQAKWFAWKRIELPAGATKFQAVVVRDLIELGVSPATALAYPKAQALKVREEMASRKRKPEDVPA